jgi:mannose-1-phosphate guanylyltransferase
MAGAEGGSGKADPQGTRRGERWVVVLAGGAGRRLGALASDSRGRTVPKQYCALRGDRSLLQMTLARAARVAPRERHVVVVDRAHERWWSPELVALPPDNVVVQPADRGTAVGIFLSLAAIRRQDPRAQIAVLPSVHYFGREEVLARKLESAFAEIGEQPGRPILLGVEPSGPDSRFGWIEGGSAPAKAGAVPVVSFHERPSTREASRLRERGALVNSLILVANLEDLLSFIERHSPLADRLRGLLEGAGPSSDELAAIYGRLQVVDLSSDLLRRAADELLVLRVDRCGWADLGTVRGVRQCLLRHRPRRLASLTGCRAPVDLSAPRPVRYRSGGISEEELSRFVEML